MAGWDIHTPNLGALPLRITSAALWISVTRHQTQNYERVLDFVNVIWKQVPGLVTYRHYLKLCIAFKAKLLMEMFVKRQSLLDILQTLEQYFPKVVVNDPKASRRDSHKERQCRLQFRKLVLLLIRDEEYREEFLQDKLEEEYGSRFMASTQRHLWEFLERLESLLPRPRIDQLLAAERSVGSLSPAEQSLLSILVNNPYTSIPDLLLTLMQRIRQRRSQDPSDHSWSETQCEIPTILSSIQSALSEGHCGGTEQVSLAPDTNGGVPVHGNAKQQAERMKGMTEPIVGVSLLDIRHEAEESVNQSQIRARAGERWGALRNEALAARKEDDREIHSSLAQGPNLAFLSLHFDQSCDEDVGNRRFWKLSPPDPLQSQVNLNSSSAVTDSLQSQATEPPSQPLNPPGLGSNIELPASKTQFSAPGSPGQGHPACLSHSLSPNQSLLQGIDLQLLTAAPLSLDVQETLLRSPLFQPKVLLLRLTGQNVRSALPAEWGVQRGDSGGDVEQFQLGSAANVSELNPRPFPWNLRKRPQRTPPDRTIEEQVMLYGSDSPFLSSEESSQSDTSDSEYFPFCSQIQHSGQWRNSIGQFIGSKG